MEDFKLTEGCGKSVKDPGLRCISEKAMAKVRNS